MVAWVQDEPAASVFEALLQHAVAGKALAEQASVITGDSEICRCVVVPVDWIPQVLVANAGACSGAI